MDAGGGMDFFDMLDADMQPSSAPAENAAKSNDIMFGESLALALTEHNVE